MAEKGRLTVNEIIVVEVDADPATSGVTAPTGSLALRDGSGLWQKVGAADTDWTPVLPAAIVAAATSQAVTESSGLVTAVVFYRSATQTTPNRIAAVAITYSAGLPTIEVWTFYQSNGTTVWFTVTVTNTWVSGALTSSAEAVS